MRRLLLITALLLTATPARAEPCASASLSREAKLACEAQARFDIWTREGRDACERGEPRCREFAALLADAASRFQRAGMLAKSIKVRKILIDPAHHLEQSDEAVAALRELGDAYAAISVWALALAWYQRYAEVAAASPDAPAVLTTVVQLALDLGQHDAAAAAAARYAQRYGASHPTESAELQLAIARDEVTSATPAEPAPAGVWRGPPSPPAVVAAPFIDTRAKPIRP